MIIPARYNGPPRTGNGGWCSGLFSSTVDGPAATVTLRRPPPLETELTVVRKDGRTDILNGQHVVAQAVPAEPPGGLVEPVPLAEAVAASPSYPGFTDHPFPTCYVCGPDRAEGDGLRIFPGVLPDGRTAAPWRVPADVDERTMWAALDCPGGWAVLGPGRPYVLGRMTAHVERAAAPGTDCVVMGQVLAREGRKATVRSAVYAADGAPLARSEATWIAI